MALKVISYVKREPLALGGKKGLSAALGSSGIGR